MFVYLLAVLSLETNEIVGHYLMSKSELSNLGRELQEGKGRAFHHDFVAYSTALNQGNIYMLLFTPHRAKKLGQKNLWITGLLCTP